MQLNRLQREVLDESEQCLREKQLEPNHMMVGDEPETIEATGEEMISSGWNGDHILPTEEIPI